MHLQILVLSTNNNNCAVYNLLARKATFIYNMNNNKPRISFSLLSRTDFCSLLALPTQCFEHFLHALRRQKLTIPLTSIPIKLLVLQTTPLTTVNKETSPKSFQLSHQQKWCFQERFPPCFLSMKDGSDQTKSFQHRGGSRQEANARAYRENTHTTSISLQGPIIWQLDTSSFFLTFCSLF